MKIKTSLFLLVLAAFFISYSCKDKGLPEDDMPTIPFEDSSLEVKVRVETDTGLINAVGALVKLYDNKDDRTDDYQVLYTASTGADGKCTFSSLAKPEYWISVQSPIDGEVQFFNEDSPFPTPGHPIVLNRLDVVFEK